MNHKLSNHQISLEVSDNAHYSIRANDIRLMDCTPHLEWEGQNVPLENWAAIKTTDDEILLQCENLIGCWRLNFRKSQNSTGKPGLSIRLTGKLHAQVCHLRFSALSGASAELTHVLGIGLKMGGCQSIVLPRVKERNFKNYYIAMLSRREKHLMISLPLRTECMPEITGNCAEKLEDFAITGVLLHQDTLDIDSGEIRLLAEDDPFRMMTDWADENRTVKKDFSAARACGWNSWDYYRWTISEEEVLTNAEFIAQDPVLSQHVKRIIVDDGWQYCYGEWDANSLFPHGMEYLARELTKLGFEPGLWFAPTIVEPHCRLAQLHPEMLALSEGGQPCLGYECMRRYGMLLDPTVPAVQKHLFNLFDRYASMGYRYFKLDFMATTLNARAFHDRTVPRSEIPRLIVKPVWEAVKGRADILGCNYAFCGGNEFVDSVRIGSDIHARWEKIRLNVVSAAANFFGNKRLWITDPDFALARSQETSDDPAMNSLNPMLVFSAPESPFQKKFSEFKLADGNRASCEVLLSIVLACGGAVNFSDKMDRLNAAGLDLVRRTAAAEPGETGIPLDIFTREEPETFLQKLSNGFRLLLINWSDDAAERVFDTSLHKLRISRAVNFWNDQPIPVTDGKILVKLPSRSCLFAVLQ